MKEVEEEPIQLNNSGFSRFAIIFYLIYDRN